ncbi:MAG: IspD/TarI family cytidylyltransferase, partial [Acidiferrobacteraceae bacterium]
MARLWAVVPAAGGGARFGGTRPKQYECIGGRPILWHAVRRVMQAPGLAGVAVGLAPEHPSGALLSGLPVAVHPYMGGAERVHTVMRGLDTLLEARADPEDWVLVHDAARPCLARTDLEHLLAAGGPEGALLGVPVTDTLKRSYGEHSIGSVPRAGLWRAFTP